MLLGITKPEPSLSLDGMSAQKEDFCPGLKEQLSTTVSSGREAGTQRPGKCDCALNVRLTSLPLRLQS